MSRRPSAPRRRRSLLRSAQRTRSEQQALARAYELALPVLRKPLTEKHSAKDSQSMHTRPIVPQTRSGG
jgi:hypothetical protein